MRRRLLLVLLAFSAFAVAAFAGPLLASTASERTQQLFITRTGDLDRFTAIAAQAGQDGDDADIEAAVRDYHGLYGEAVVVVRADGTPVIEQGMSMTDPGVAAAIADALTNQPAAPFPDLRPWSSHDLLLAKPIGTDTQVIGAVALRSSVRAAAADIAAEWAGILVTALAAAVVCVLLALLLARWVLRPLAELERGVLAVTAGLPNAPIGESSGPPELRVLAGSFNRMSQAVTESAEQQRRLVADASHQLRSPIARLRLPVDALDGQITPGGYEAYDRIVAEVEELESLSSSLLGLAEADRTATELAGGDGGDGDACGDGSCDATELLVERREAWLPTARRAGVELHGPGSVQPVRLGCPEIELKQVLDVALENAIKYAGAGAQVRMECSALSGRGLVAITDDGPGLSPQELPKATTRFWRSRRHHGETGSGLGLALAERLVTARGGVLDVRANRPRGLVVEVALPLVEEVTC